MEKQGHTKFEKTAVQGVEKAMGVVRLSRMLRNPINSGFIRELPSVLLDLRHGLRPTSIHKAEENFKNAVSEAESRMAVSGLKLSQEIILLRDVGHKKASRIIGIYGGQEIDLCNATSYVYPREDENLTAGFVNGKKMSNEEAGVLCGKLIDVLEKRNGEEGIIPDKLDSRSKLIGVFLDNHATIFKSK